MKSANLILALMLAASLTARAALYTETYNSGFANSGNVPDDNTAGWSDAETVSGVSGAISSISVNLDVQGGYNGDLYGYLEYNGTLVTLLNRTGIGATTPTSTSFGYGNSGFNVTFSSTAANNIHFYQNVAGYSINGTGQLTGTWQPDGSTVNPVTGSPASYDTGTGVQTLAAFNGLPTADGTWTLFLADVSAGGGTSQVISYSIDITTVPEPANTALGIFAGILILGAVLRTERARRVSARIFCRSEAKKSQPDAK